MGNGLGGFIAQHPVVSVLVIAFVIILVMAMKSDKIDRERKRDVWYGPSKGYVKRELDRKEKQNNYEIIGALAAIVVIIFLIVKFWNYIQGLR